MNVLISRSLKPVYFKLRRTVYDDDSVKHEMIVNGVAVNISIKTFQRITLTHVTVEYINQQL